MGEGMISASTLLVCLASVAAAFAFAAALWIETHHK
jgi:hypothetical protein